MPNYVAGTGSLSPKLMIVGEAPGKRENESGLPFQGPAGQILDELLFKAGIRRSECYITNVVKYQPPYNDFTKLHLIGVDLEQSVKELWENEINRLKPNCILVVGNHALNAVCGVDGILNYRGSILTAVDSRTKCVAMVHPAALFNRVEGSNSDGEGGESKGGLSWTYLKLMEADVRRAAEESVYPDINLPARELSIAYNSLELFRYFREYEKLTDCASDIESINCIPATISFAFNRHHAISVPLLTHIGKHKLTDMSEDEMDEVWRILDEQLRRLNLIGHNFMYDEYKLGLIGFRKLRVKSDTLIKTRVIFPELPVKRLHVLSSLWTRQPYYKEEGKEFKLGKVRIEQLLRYNAMDSAVDKEVDEEQEKDLEHLAERYQVPLRSYYYNYQMRKHSFYLKMQNNGFRINMDRKNELAREYQAMADVVHKRIEEAVGHEVNVKSSPQKFDLLYKEFKFKPFKRQPTSEDAIVALMANHCKGKKAIYKPILADILEESRIRDQKSRYINYKPDYDGRCKTSFNIIATETCRSSTSVPKKPLRPKKIGLAFHTISKHGRLAKAIRSQFIPDSGKVFLQADSSQAEARVVAVLSEDWELLQAFDRIDIHRRTAALIFGYTRELELGDECSNSIVDYLDKDGVERFSGKKTRHAGNYNMKKRRFMTEYNTDCQKFEIESSISEWRAGQYLDAFHAASPRIRGIFHRDVIDCINSTRAITDPYGGVRVFNGRMDDELYKEGFANIPQRTVGHLVQTAALNIDDELNGDVEQMWLSENHDSLLMQVPANNWEPYARLMKKHFMVPIDFRTYCSLKRDYTLVIPCDIEISDTNYAELKKVKIA